MPENGYTGFGPGLDVGDFVDLFDVGRDFYRGITGSDGVPRANGNGAAAPAPSNGSMPARENCIPQTLAIGQKTIASCPKGYVAVDTNGDGRGDVCVLRSCARHYGWKPSAKPPIKAGDWKALKRAHSTIKKLDRVVKMGNEIVGKAKYTRSRR